MKEVSKVKGEGGEVIPGIGLLLATKWEEKGWSKNDDQECVYDTIGAAMNTYRDNHWSSLFFALRSTLAD